jgi:7,8-dihydropterin-6-yl-methyl-4-(beta-D-ribofuranosyl)aminobenzene 5'-phosphate synthase
MPFGRTLLEIKNMPEKIEVTVLVDNTIDIFIPSTEVATYPVPGKGSMLWAEQGLSLWIDVWNQGGKFSLLYDFGRSEDVPLRNAQLLGFDFSRLDAMALSHGHIDHYGCLLPVLKKTKQECTLFCHPKACGQKRFVLKKDGTYAGPWEIDEQVFDRFVSRIQMSAAPVAVAPGVHLSGQIERGTDFEPGMPNAFVEMKGERVHDDIMDDQAVFIELGDDRLVVVTGCCHAGSVNTLEQARRQFPKRKVHALLGGLHLNSAGETQMEKTMEYISQAGIDHMAAFHCTGYYAQRTLMERFREQWIPATVGAKMTFI